jgi:aspartate aminotransferase
VPQSAAPQLSDRIQRLAESPTLAFNTRAKELIRSGVDIIAMTAGEPDFQPPEHVIQAAREALELGMTKYTPAEGSMELRQAVAGKFRRENALEYGTDQILISNGGKQVLYNGFLSVLEPGDEVIIPAPYWVSYPPQVELAGGVPVIVSASVQDGFVPDPADIKAAVTDRTRIIVLNSPSNPTGAVYPREVIREIVEFAAERNIWIFTDDLYEHLVYDGEFTAAASFAPEHVLVVHGASKSYALTGWRIGYGAGPKALISAMAKLQGQVTNGPNSLAQHATVAALNEVEKTREFLEMTKRAYRERRDVLVAGLNRLGLPTNNPQGAFYVMADTSAIDPDDNRAALILLEEAHVGVVPGSGFHAPGLVRLSYATSLAQVNEALERIGRLLASR